MRTFTLLAVLLSGAVVLSLPRLQSNSGLEEARKQFKAAQLEQAADLYRKVVAEQPTLVAGHVELIRSLLEMNDLKSAIATSSRAASALPQSAPILAALGDVLFRVGKVPEASQAYRRALEIDPKLARAWGGNGRVQRFSAMGKQARNSFIAAYGFDPNDADIVRDWAFTNAKAAEIAAGLERHIELASHRGKQYETQQRAEVASVRYLGDRKPCEVATPLAKTTIRMEVTDKQALPVAGLGATLEINRPDRPWVNATAVTFSVRIPLLLIKETGC